jgi:hypothetical protein
MYNHDVMAKLDVPLVSMRREEIEHARRLSIRQKLELGGELFDAACEVMIGGIRADQPDISDSEVLQILRDRLRLARRLETRA